MAHQTLTKTWRQHAEALHAQKSHSSKKHSVSALISKSYISLHCHHDNTRTMLVRVQSVMRQQKAMTVKMTENGVRKRVIEADRRGGRWCWEFAELVSRKFVIQHQLEKHYIHPVIIFFFGCKYNSSYFQRLWTDDGQSGLNTRGCSLALHQP